MKYRTWVFLCGAGLAVPAAAAAQAPQDSLAFAGPRGVYLWTGGAVVSRAHPVDGVVAHRVERRASGEQTWRQIAEVEAAGTAAAFFAPLDSVTRSRVRAILDQPSDEAVWDYIVRFPRADSLAGIIGHEGIRLGLGIYALDPGATPGRWEYRISDVDAGGAARNARVTTPVAVPSDVVFAPIRTAGVEEADSSLVVHWYIERGHQGRFLEVWRADGRQGEFRLVDSLGVLLLVNDSLQARYHDRAVTPGTMYRYFLVPRDVFGNRGAPSDTTTLYSVPFRALALPDSLRVEAADSLGMVVRWRFRRPDRIRSIRVYRSDAMEGPWSLVGEVMPTEGQFVDPDPPVMRMSYYRLTMISLRGDESPPTATTFGHFRSPFPPAAPQLVAADTTGGRVRLTWLTNSEDDLRGYLVYRAGGVADTAMPGAFTVVSDLIPSADTTWLDSTSAFQPGQGYAYAVQAINTSERQSPLSAPRTVAPVPLPPPAPPTAPVACASTGMTCDSATCRWADTRWNGAGSAWPTRCGVGSRSPVRSTTHWQTPASPAERRTSIAFAPSATWSRRASRAPRCGCPCP
jgi:hypothetical protein